MWEVKVKAVTKLITQVTYKYQKTLQKYNKEIFVRYLLQYNADYEKICIPYTLLLN